MSIKQTIKMKNILNVPCNSCGKLTKNIKKELFGLFFIIIVIPYLLIFGINAGSIIYSIIFLSVGLYWVIAKPSKKIICEECIAVGRKTANLE